jgi:type III pantothenate kinase
MLLLIDAGNTRIKWALVEEGPITEPRIQLKTEPKIGSKPGPHDAWFSSGSVSHDRWAGVAQAWRQHAIGHALVCNVAGAAVEAAIEEELLHLPGLRLAWFHSSVRAGGVRNTYRDPLQLGADRMAAAIGAVALYPAQPLIIATCGTATTVDAVSPDAAFLGGMILPGLGLMASALARGTAQLPLVADHQFRLREFSDNTDDAIASGCIAAQTGAIERAVAAMEHEYGAARCIMSGGAAAIVSRHLQKPHEVVENLVLIGLRVVATAQPES